MSSSGCMLAATTSTSNIAIARICVKTIEWDKWLCCQKGELNEKLSLSGVGVG